MIFYPCKEDAFVVLRDVATENTLIHVRRPDVNVVVGTLMHRLDNHCDPNKWTRLINEKNDAIINAYK